MNVAAASDLAPALPNDPRYDRVLRDAVLSRDLLNDFWSRELSARYGLRFDTPDAFGYYFSVNSRGCGGPAQPQTRNAFYCFQNGNEFVAFDIDWFVANLDRFPGDALTFLILSHEWGHAVQDTWQEQQPGADRWVPAYLQELNADCLAGVFIGDAVRSGALIEEPGDAEAIYQAQAEFGSSDWFAPGSHGTSAQRQVAFSDGVNGGTQLCRTRY